MSEDTDILLSHQFRKIRKDRGWTLEKAAEKIGITHSHLSQIERGNRNPSLPVERAMRRFIVENGIPVVGDGLDEILALNPREVALVRAFRKLSRSLQEHHLTILTRVTEPEEPKH